MLTASVTWQAAPEDELRLALGLQNYTSGKGKVELKDSSMRPIEIFMCSVVSFCQYCSGFFPCELTLYCWTLLSLNCTHTLFWQAVICHVLLHAICSQRFLHMQVRRMGYGEGFRWLSQYIK